MSGMTIEQAWQELDAGIQALPPRLSEECEAALATLRAEIEALRAEVETWRTYSRGKHGLWQESIRRAERLAEAGRRVTAAFRALGETTAWTRAAEQARHECEAAMLALDAALEQEEGRG